MILHQWVAFYLGKQLEEIVKYEKSCRISLLGFNLSNFFSTGQLSEQELLEATCAVEKFKEMSELTPSQIASGEMLRCRTELSLSENAQPSIIEEYVGVLFKELSKFLPYFKAFSSSTRDKNQRDDGFEIISLTKEYCRNDLITFLIKQYFIILVEKINRFQRALSNKKKGISNPLASLENTALANLQEWLYERLMLIEADELPHQSMESILNDLLTSLESVAKPEILMFIAGIKSELIIKKSVYPKEGQEKAEKEKESLKAAGIVTPVTPAAVAVHASPIVAEPPTMRVLIDSHERLFKAIEAAHAEKSPAASVYTTPPGSSILHPAQLPIVATIPPPASVVATDLFFSARAADLSKSNASLNSGDLSLNGSLASLEVESAQNVPNPPAANLSVPPTQPTITVPTSVKPN